MDTDQMFEDFMKMPCRIKEGDVISMNNRPLDLMKVLEVIPAEDGYNIKIQYLNRGIGPFERIYKDSFFKEDKCVIKRKGVVVR